MAEASGANAVNTPVDLDTMHDIYDALNTKKLVVIDFQSSFCMHCNVIKPSFRKLATAQEAKDMKFCVVEIPDIPEALEEFAITKVPTFIAFDGKMEIHRYVGRNAANLVQFLQDSRDLKLSKNETLNKQSAIREDMGQEENSDGSLQVAVENDGANPS